jgi:ATP-dependent DNA helicase PIF1
MLYKQVDGQVVLNLDKILQMDNLKTFKWSIENFTKSQHSIFTYVTERIGPQKEQVLGFITGPAGTGKSHLIKALCSYIHDTLGLNVARTATTGTAACGLGGTTLHAYLGVTMLFRRKFSPGTVQADVLRKTDVIVVDEVSMFTADFFEILQQILSDYPSGNKKQGALFGGKSIILLGDPAQLPPVKGEPCFADPVFARHFKPLVLRQVVRQQDKEFLKILYSIRLGEKTEETIQFLRDHILHSQGVRPGEQRLILRSMLKR